MSRIIGAVVGTPISPQASIEKTAQAKTIEENAAHTKNTAIHVTATESRHGITSRTSVGSLQI
jgi:hypothetical protein